MELVLYAVTKSGARDEAEKIHWDQQKEKVINAATVEFPHSTWSWVSETEKKQSVKL